ncbi:MULTISPECIES: SirB2 family protein [Lysobacteraceae]|uniref:SirB2 family protein n=1 Tax=Novilysobacter avium TaxID=2781023 RepID=A0A7S6UJZ8_9GAMM|nr:MULTISPECIES: SirB2 family protein [Lysobacter]QOW21713.1 SirB2 family protein [Lysobacter avium]QOW24197.1 SirB2 family protein [Lysobacter sp. H23M47]
MIEFYPQIKSIHIAMAITSGLIFALRGAGVLAGMRWPHWLPVRWTSYTVDTALLTAALMLLTMLPGAMFANGWLTVKLLLLVVYIVLGVFAIKRGRTRLAKAGFYVAALLTFGMVYSIARAHSPWGFLNAFLG